MPGTFVFRPLEANISHKDQLLAKINPYCSLVLGDQKFNSKTSVNKGGQHPIWKDIIDVPVTNESSLVLKVLDQDKSVSDELLGIATIDLKNIKSTAPSQNWFPLLYKNKPAGEILLETSFEGGDFKRSMKDETARSSLQSSDVNLFAEQNLGFSGIQSQQRQKRIFTEHREIVQPHMFTKNIETCDMVPAQREIEVLEPRKIMKEVEFTEIIPVKKMITTNEPTVVSKEVELIESRVVTKTIEVIESVPVKKMVDVVEMRQISKEVETFEPRTFKKTIEVTEQVPVKKLVTVHEPVFHTEAVEFVEPVITIQKVTKEILEPIVISQRTTQEIGAATLAHTQHQSRIFKGERELKGEYALRGEQEFRGEYGLKGEREFKGEQWLSGEQGLKGDLGFKGEQGLRGEYGHKGEYGMNLEHGLKGDLGIKGDQGFKGEYGLKGEQGLGSEQGFKAEYGYKEEFGLKGERGFAGGEHRSYTQGWQEDANLRQKAPEEHFKEGYLTKVGKKVLGEEMTANIQQKVEDIKKEFPSLGESSGAKKTSSLKEGSSSKVESGHKGHKGKIEGLIDSKKDQEGSVKNLPLSSKPINM